MIQAIRSGGRIAKDHRGWRLLSAIVVLSLMALTSACEKLVKVSDQSIPKLITPLAASDFKGLVAQLQPFMSFQTLRSSRVLIQFLDAEAAERYSNADAQLVLQRPSNIRLIIQVPVTGSKIAEMVADPTHFKVAIYTDRYKRFLTGTNNADYSHLREKLGREQQRALLNARPFHFTDALMVRPLHIGEAGYIYSLEEALAEEPDQRQGAKRGAQVLRSFYVVSEIELATEQSPARTLRRFWFDRTNQLRLARQQIFDGRGELATEVRYSNYLKLNPESAEVRPSVILITRPRDSYSARLTFVEGRTEFNPNLPETAFALENRQGLPETNLDKP
jgi:hypothetical protein